MFQLLGYKDSYILNFLVNSNQLLTIVDISRLIGISQRSAYYSISRINDYLESENLPKIINKRQQGLLVNSIIKERLQDSLFSGLQNHYVCTQQERNAIETMLLLTEGKYINVSFLENIFQVSRNTIISDIKEIKKMLDTFNLVLEFDTHKGYVIEGSVIRKRSVILNIISSYEYLLKINSYEMYDNEYVEKIHSLFNEVEEQLGIQYVYNTLFYLSILVSIIIKNDIDKVSFNKEDILIIENSKEFTILKNIFVFPELKNELHYLALHLMGLRIQNHHVFEDYNNDEVIDIVNYMISEFSRITLIYFDNEDSLFKDLYLHMRQAMFRLKYGIIFENELKDQIFEQYPQISYVSRLICTNLEERLGYPIGDDDVAYIAMHFGGHLKREKRDIPKIRVLLVCLNGVASSKLLKKELNYLLGNIEIIDVVRKDEIELYKNEVDYIISTIPIKDDSLADRVIQVNTILNDVDKNKIINTLGISLPNTTELELANKIFQDIEEFIPKQYHQEVSRKIISRITKKKSTIDYVEGNEKPMLKQIISEDKIMFIDHVDNWEEAIKKSAEPLLQNGYIEQRYIDKVIQNVKELGPYIVIAPMIAISHARPSDGVNHLGMTMMILKEQVNFSQTKDRNVRIIVTLASPDDEKHLLALQQISMLFMNSLDQLLNATTKEEVLDLIEKYSKEEV